MTPLQAIFFWMKALHIISVVAWMAGLLYLPRLFVYHAGVAPGSEASETFKVMERRLLHAIMTPAMIATYAFGMVLAATPHVVDWGDGWMYAKLGLVGVLTGVHFIFARWRQDFADDRNRRPARFYRIANEVPTALMTLIVILVVVKPF
jgi:protoporphyrinogen IX oxidase